MNYDRSAVEQEERLRLARECPKFLECMDQYVAIVRPGELCNCLEEARHRILCADAGVLQFASVLPPEYEWTRTYSGSLFVYSDSIVRQRDFIATVIAARISYTTRGMLSSVDEFYYSLEEQSSVLPDVLRKPLLGVYGCGLGGSMHRRLAGLLHTRRAKGLFGYFGLVASSFEDVTEDVQRALGVFRDEFSEVLL